MIQLSMVNQSETAQWIRLPQRLSATSKYMTLKYTTLSCHDARSGDLILVPGPSLEIVDRDETHLILKVSPGSHSLSYNLRPSDHLYSERDRVPGFYGKLETPVLDLQLMDASESSESKPVFRRMGSQKIELPEKFIAGSEKNDASATALFAHCKN